MPWAESKKLLSMRGGGQQKGTKQTWDDRQKRLGIQPSIEVLECHEIVFLERFAKLGETFKWISKSDVGKSTNDFLWESHGTETELKTLSSTKYSAASRRISNAVTSAAEKHHVTKDVFILDYGETKQQLRKSGTHHAEPSGFMFFENRHRRLTQVIPSHRQQQPMDLIQPCIGVRHGVLRLIKVRQSVTEKQVKVRIRALTNLVGYLLGFSTMVTRRRSQIPNEHRQSRHCFIRALNHIHYSGDTRIIMTEHHHAERQLVIDAGFEHTALRAISIILFLRICQSVATRIRNRISTQFI